MKIFPTATTPAYVYEVDIPDPVPPGITLLDPVKDVAATLPSPATALSYFHDGDKDFILGVASPNSHGDASFGAGTATALGWRRTERCKFNH